MKGPPEVSLAALALLSPIAAHLFFVNDSPFNVRFPEIGCGLILGQGVLAYLILRPRIDTRYRLAVMAIIGAVALSIAFHIRSGLVLTCGVPHALTYSVLLAVFGASLLPGREPVITYFARAIHGSISTDIARYTRRVTWAWCAFCALQLIGSAVLLVLAPIVWWSTFVNILNLPLVALMLVGERLTRPLWVANPPRELLSDMLRMPGLLRQSLRKPSADAL